MLIIRKEQMDTLRAAALGAFEEAMAEHLGGLSPFLSNAVGPDQLRKAVRLGIERAAGYGFDCRGAVRLYLELMLLFGSYFDTDPQYPWAAEILADRDSDPQLQRAARLYEQALDYLCQVAGPEEAHLLKALKNIRAFAKQPLSFAPDDLVSTMLGEITLIYPEKAAYVGQEGLAALIRKAGQGARNMRFETPRGMALVVELMLVFGHGCGADPLYPWIAQTLRDETTNDPAAKAKQLEMKAMAWLEQMMVHFGRGTTINPPDAGAGANQRYDTITQAFALQ
jgi:hypothetical protein